jgi:membrane protease YdiL (CAAX protease family)
MTLLSLLLAVVCGVFNPRKIHGPDRLLPNESRLLLLQPIGYAFLAWGVAQWVLISFFLPAAQGPQHELHLSDMQSVVFNGVVDLAVFVAMVVAVSATRARGLRRLGLNLSKIPSGFFIGIVGILIALPIVFWIDLGTEWLWERLHLEHPKAHEMLLILDRRPAPWLVAAMLLVAGVIVPLAEETFFRGHIQTVLRYATNRPWAAVLLSSMLFALVHPWWSIPQILCLGICLGYAYERTGNLWTSVTIHALFNLTSIAAYYNVHP